MLSKKILLIANLGTIRLSPFYFGRATDYFSEVMSSALFAFYLKV